MERVSVIIANWNRKELLKPCLDSLYRQTFKDFAIYVVDNGSTDGSVELLRRSYSDVRLIEFPENRGFSVAKNAAIEASSGEFVASLDNDTEADPHWLEELVRILDARPDIGFCASMVLDYYDRSIIDSIGDGYGYIGISFKIGSEERDTGQFTEPFEVLGASACASIYRRSMLQDVGTFDEDFFAYMEDVDISIRARLAGYRCLAVPSAKVYHIGHATTGGTTSEFSLEMTSKNIYNILIKDIPATLLFPMLPLAVGAQIYLLIVVLATGRHAGIRKSLRGYFRGLGALWRDAPKMWKKRSEVQRLRRISVKEFFALMRLAESQKKAYRRCATHAAS